MFGVGIGCLSYQSLVEELEIIVWVGVGWFVVDIVGCSSSLFEGIECGDFGVGMRWHKRCVVVWSGADKDGWAPDLDVHVGECHDV